VLTRPPAPAGCSSPRPGCGGDGQRKAACGGVVLVESVMEAAERDGWARDGWAGIQEAVRAASTPHHTSTPLPLLRPQPFFDRAPLPSVLCNRVLGREPDAAVAGPGRIGCR
jgi:hypothetical protein